MRYYVMYDHSTFETNVQVNRGVSNCVTFLVASFSDFQQAKLLAEAINVGTVDLFDIPGPWHKIYSDIDKSLGIEESTN